MPREYVKEYFDSPASWQETLLPYQVQMQRDIVRLIPSDVTTVLDAGCGNGLITNILPDWLQVTGLDRSATALADVHWPTAIGDVTDLPYPDQSFDLVMCNDVIEHLDDADRQQAVRELARVTNRYLIISIPFRENLAQNAVKCANCGRRYHINHHLHSFGLKTVPQLLEGSPLTCLRQVLSGDCWHRDPPAVIALRRYLGLEYPPTDNPVCTSCGDHNIELERGSQHLRGFLDWAAAGLFLLHPELRDYGTTRTECISLFRRGEVEPSEHRPAQAASASLENGNWLAVDESRMPVSLSETLCPIDRIDFSQSDFHMREWLPRSGHLPYAVTNEATGSPQLVTEGSTLFCGFFQQPGNSGEAANLEIAGFSASPAQFDVSAFDEVKSYRLVKRLTVDGDFRVLIPCAPSLSRYGYLFKLDGIQGLSEMRSVRLCRGGAPSARFLQNNSGNIQFLTQERFPELSVSLPIYGSNIDVDSVVAAAAMDAEYPSDSEILEDPVAIRQYLETCLDQLSELESLAPDETLYQKSLKTLKRATQSLT